MDKIYQNISFGKMVLKLILKVVKQQNILLRATRLVRNSQVCIYILIRIESKHEEVYAE